MTTKQNLKDELHEIEQDMCNISVDIEMHTVNKNMALAEFKTCSEVKETYRHYENF